MDDKAKLQRICEQLAAMVYEGEVVVNVAANAAGGYHRVAVGSPRLVYWDAIGDTAEDALAVAVERLATLYVDPERCPRKRAAKRAAARA